MTLFSRRAACEQLVLLLAAWCGTAACRPGNDDSNPVGDELSKRMKTGAVSAATGNISLPYRLFIPDGYQPERRYPLVLFLHSAAARGVDNVSHLRQDVAEWVTRAQRFERAFILAPHCPPKHQWVPAVRGRPFKNYDQSKVEESQVGALVLRAVADVQERYSIDADRVYITGASMGAVGTWDLITRHPHQFAAAIPCTGVNDPKRASAIAQLPIWTFHGALDQANPVQNTREMVKAFRKLGGNVRYTEYPDVSHNSWNRAYATDELYAWLFVQRRQ